MSREALEALRARVHGDLELARRLHGTEPAEFTGATTRLASELGYDINANDVRDAIAEWVRAWIMRWIR